LSTLDVVPAWGKAGLEAMREVYSHAAFVVRPVQEVPLPTSRVTVEARVQDRYAMPAVRLLGEGPHDEDLRAAEFMVERARDWLRATGGKRVHPSDLSIQSGRAAGQHKAGTCRMGLDPRTSVTDPRG
jgi:choline dehydrogenase-like flavoprotein